MPDVDRLINAIDAAAENAYGGDNDGELSTERALALDYYNGRNVEPAPEGRSQVSDRSVFEVIQWILPSLCRIFANGDNVVEFTPVGPEDEEAAKQEGDYLNYLVTQKNPWFLTFLTWAQDALQLKNAYCLAHIEKKLQVETERYEGQSDEQVALLVQDEGVEIVEFQSYPDGEPQLVPDPMTGQPVLVPPSNKHDIVIRRVTPQERLRFKVLPPERCLVSEQTSSFSLEDCDYFEYYDDVTISSLRSQGFEVPDDIASEDGAEPDTDTDDARNTYNEREGSENPVDPAMKLVRARMIWIRHDYDEDGISEMQKVIRVGRTILDREEANRIPVASIVPLINSHRHVGTSIADCVVDIQRISTAILRQGLDNLYLSNNPRNVVSGMVNLDDMSISAPGAYVRLNDDSGMPADGHVVPIPTPFVFPQAMEGLEYMDSIKEKRAGVNRTFSGVDASALSKQTPVGTVQQLSTMAGQRVEQIARIMSVGVEYLFSVAHELILKSGHKAEKVKLRGGYVDVDPSQWRTKRDMRICVGYGAGNKDALAARLMGLMGIQKEALAGGLRIATEQNIYETAIEYTKASDFTAPQRFFTDPASLPPPPPPGPSPDVQLASQVELQKTQSSERVKAAEIQSQERVKAAELAQKDRHAELQAELQVVLEQMKQGGSVDLERLRGAIKNAPIVEKNQKIDENSKVLEALAGLQQQNSEAMKGMAERLDAAIQAMSRPKKIIRDKNGRVEGVQ